MSHTDEIAVLKVEAVQLVASLLGIQYVFIDDEGGALGVGRDALSDLATRQSQHGSSIEAVYRDGYHTEWVRICRRGQRVPLA